jgi:hypothetical protein
MKKYTFKLTGDSFVDLHENTSLCYHGVYNGFQDVGLTPPRHSFSLKTYEKDPKVKNRLAITINKFGSYPFDLAVYNGKKYAVNIQSALIRLMKKDFDYSEPAFTFYVVVENVK